MTDENIGRYVDADTGEVVDAATNTGMRDGGDDTVDVTGGDVEHVPALTQEITGTSREITRYLAGTSNVAEESAESAAFEIVERILRAQSAEEVLRRQQVYAGTDLIGFPLQVQRVRWHQSAYDQREGVYALVEAKREDTGEEVIITSGSRNVIAQLWRLGELDAYPIAVKFGRADKPTAAGYYPLWLEPAT